MHDGEKTTRSPYDSGGNLNADTTAVVCKRFGLMGECREPNSKFAERGCSNRKVCGLDPKG